MRISKILTTSTLMLGASVMALGAQEASENERTAAMSSTQQSAQQDGTACPSDWNLVDANDNGNVSRSELDSAVEAQFSAVDLDGSGAISEAEYVACVTAVEGRIIRPHSTIEMQQQASQQDQTGMQAGQQGMAQQNQPDPGPDQQQTAELDQQSEQDQQQDQVGAVYPPITPEDLGLDPAEPGFSAADADQSGDVSREEAAAAAEEGYEAGAGASMEEHAQKVAQWFESMDLNDDDQLILNEWLVQNRVPGSAAAPPMGFAKADTDSSNTVSEEEYRQAVATLGATSPGDRNTAAQGSAGEPDAQPRPEFSALDSDGNGELTRTEWQSATQTQDVARDFALLDDNDDGEISQDEWRSRTSAKFEQSASAQGAGNGGPVTVWFYHIF